MAPLLMQRKTFGRVTSRKSNSRPLICKAASDKENLATTFAKKAVATGAAALLSLGALSGVALANEFDVVGEAAPSQHYYVDDANVISRSNRGDIDYKLKRLEIETGYRLTAITVRKLEFEPDTYAFADKVMESWYPNATDADKKGLLLLVTAGKEGAVSGGQGFLKVIGEDLAESIVSENIPIFSEQEKYNECLTSSLNRLEAQIKGETVPEAPKRNEENRVRTYKTKEEVEKSKSVTTSVVVTLLIIAVVVPMLQYYGYTARD